MALHHDGKHDEMSNRSFLLGIALLVAGAIAVLVWQPFGHAGNTQQTMMATSREPALICLKVDRATIDGLISRKKTLSAVVKSYDPQDNKNHSFKVSVVSGDAKTRQVVSYFGLTTGAAFKGSKDDEFQRYRVPLSKTALERTYSEELCLEIAFEADSGSARGGRAEVALEIVARKK